MPMAQVKEGTVSAWQVVAVPIIPMTISTNSTYMSHYLEIRGIDAETVKTRTSTIEALLDKADAYLESITRLKVYEKLFASSIDSDKSMVECTLENENGFDFTDAHLIEKNATTTKLRIFEYDYNVSSLDLSRHGVFPRITSELKSTNEPAITIATKAEIKRRAPSTTNIVGQGLLVGCRSCQSSE